ncbi:MAG: hypothetical protein ACTSPT_06390 [Candidatus Heimdallarchaeota archaeon]
MFRRKSTLIGIFAVILSLSSLFFLPISIGVGEIENPVMDTLGVGEDLVNEQGLDEPISNEFIRLKLILPKIHLLT